MFTDSVNPIDLIILHNSVNFCWYPGVVPSKIWVLSKFSKILKLKQMDCVLNVQGNCYILAGLRQEQDSIRTGSRSMDKTRKGRQLEVHEQNETRNT